MNGSGVLASLPSTLTGRRVLVRLGGEVHNDLSSPHVSVLPIEKTRRNARIFDTPIRATHYNILRLI